MKLISMEQRTPEWYALRKNSLGASDAAAVMGVSPWKSNVRLWEEKIGFVEPDATINQYMQRGIDMEPEALARVCKDHGIQFVPQIGVHDTYDWLIASFDGLDPVSGIHVEIKCPGAKDHAEAREGNIPKKYVPQLQHQLLVSGAEYCWYASYRPEGAESEHVQYVKVYRDGAYQSLLKAELVMFWQCVQKLQQPEPKSVEEAHINREASLSWQHWRDEYVAWERAEKAAKERKEYARQKLLDEADGTPSCGYGLKLSRVIRPGAIDYEKIVRDYEIKYDAQKYMKPSSDSWRITLEKEKCVDNKAEN